MTSKWLRYILSPVNLVFQSLLSNGSVRVRICGGRFFVSFQLSLLLLLTSSIAGHYIRPYFAHFSSIHLTPLCKHM